MNTFIIYFSYTGKTKLLAERKAAEENADILPLTLKKRRGKFLTYTAGSLAAMRRKKAKLNDFDCDFSKYKRFVIAMPIWAGLPAPAMNNIVPLIPAGSEVELIFTSGSGNSKKSGVKYTEAFAKNGATVTKVSDVKAAEII
jgi:hypothetical protein